MTTEEQPTQVVKGLRAGRVVPQSFFVELGSLLVVVPAEHRVALVVERRWVVAVGGHGQVGVSVGLIVVFLLPGDRDVNPPTDPPGSHRMLTDVRIFVFTRKKRKDRLVAAMLFTLLSFFSKVFSVSTA